MKFIFPTFLFALFAIIIPILIHLFSFRRFTTVYFSNVSYLKNIKNESQRQSRLKNLLILISRILAIVSLVFVFAQPYIPNKTNKKQQADPLVAVYIDNSFSMNAVSPEGQLLEVARNKAIEISGAYSPGTRFQLITNDLLQQHRHFFNKEQFIQQVSEVKTSSNSVALSKIQKYMVNNVINFDRPSSLTGYYISDFQTKTTDIQNFTSDTNQINYFLPLHSEVYNNLYIDTCWMEVPAHKIGQEEKLNVRVVNHSSEAYQNLPLKFYLDDTLKALGNFSIEPGKDQTIQLKYVNLYTGIHRGKAEITDYPFTHDNSYFLNYFVQPNLKALAIYDGKYGAKSGIPWLKALFDDDEFVVMDFNPVENLQVSKLSGYNTIFLLNTKFLSSGLINELKKTIENGTSVLFFPEPDGEIQSYNDFLNQLNANTILRFDTTSLRISGIDWDHPVFNQVFEARTENVDFPFLHGCFVFSQSTRIPESNLLWFGNKSKTVSIQPAGDGNLVVFSFPLSGLNKVFARDGLFVPLMYSLTINSLPYQKLCYKIGTETYGILPGQLVPDFTSIHILSKDSSREYIPSITVLPGNRLKFNFTGFFREAGHYMVSSSGKTVTAISMNYDRSESDLNFYTPQEISDEIGKSHIKYTSVIETQSKNFTQVFNEIQHGRKLWKIFLILALLFLMAEVIIIRFWK
jgi:hypothetical protein